MAEHDEKLFEHEFEEKLRKFDSSIKIPEIPDAQSIFEKAESEKPKVIPFKKYSRYVAAAAAVVLISVTLPLISSASSAESAPQEPESAKYYATDEAVEEEICEAIVEEAEEPKEFSQITTSINENNNQYDESPAETESKLYSMLFEFFENGGENELKESSAVSSSDANPETGGSDGNPELGGVGDSERDLKIEHYGEGFSPFWQLEKVNKKRSVEIVSEEESISVRVFDTSAGDEVISVFWVEGAYMLSSPGEEIYTICLSKKITEEDFESGNYIPMAGDPVNGNYFVPEEDISLPKRVKYGEVYIIVEIDLKTGEYEIHANLR